MKVGLEKVEFNSEQRLLLCCKELCESTVCAAWLPN